MCATGTSDLYSGGSSSAGTALVESGNCNVSFILNRGIVTEVTPWSQDGVQCIQLHQSCCQPGRCPADGLAGVGAFGVWERDHGEQCDVCVCVVSVSSRDNNE